MFKIISKLILAAPLALSLAVTGCTESEEPEAQEPQTVRERAQAVGKFGDHTLTNTLEDDLVGVVDQSAEQAQRLKDAAAVSDE